MARPYFDPPAGRTLGRSALRGTALLVLLLVLAAPVATATGHVSLARGSAEPNTSPLQISSFVASPSSFVLSNPTYLNVTATGGVPPYSYWYSALPPGCLSANVSSLFCQPREVESFNVTVWVNDSNRTNVSASVQIHVTSGYVGPPVIQSVVISPNPVAVNHLTVITVNAVSVSHSVLGFFYFDLPPGCASFNQTPLNCLPSQGGSYLIGIQVVDAFGQPVITHTTLTVTGSSGASPSSGHGALPTYLLYGVPVVVILAAIAIGVVLFRRPRRRAPPTEYTGPGPKP